MDKHITHLVLTMDENRHRHGKCWEKVRRDRIWKLLDENLCIEDVELIIETAIRQGKLKACQKESDEEGLRAAIKLVTFNYRSPYGYHE
jgi:hypothetical protein